MITINWPIELKEQDSDFIKELQREQSPMIRSAYAQARLGLAEISVRAELRERFKQSPLDSWFIQSAVKSGMGMADADRKLEIDNRIFGGKKNFKKRCEGKITSEEWKELRLLPLYSIGEAIPKGNRKFDFHSDKIIFKPYKGVKIEIPIPSLKKNWRKLYDNLVLLTNQKSIPVTVSLTSKGIALSFDEQKVSDSYKNFKKPIETRYAGIDLNPNFIGISVFDGNRIVATKLYKLSELTGKISSDKKLECETFEIANDLGRWLKHLQVNYVFIEELSFAKGDSGLGKNFNRLTKNKWKREKFLDCLGKYFKLIKINAAYTSTIGNVLHPELPDAVAASTEVAQRGYRIVVQKLKQQFYPPLPEHKDIADRWKETDIPLVNDWKELHNFLKKAGLRYRVPHPPDESFRIFKSEKSSVYIVDNFLHN